MKLNRYPRLESRMLTAILLGANEPRQFGMEIFVFHHGQLQRTTHRLLGSDSRFLNFIWYFRQSYRR
jgi:hypothetical protein